MNEDEIPYPRVRGDRADTGVVMDEKEATTFLATFAGRTIDQAIEAGQAYRKGDKLYIKKQ